MSTLYDMKDQIQQLPAEQVAELRYWLNRLDEDDWDRQMQEDAQTGRLDRFITRVDQEIDNDRLLDFPSE